MANQYYIHAGVLLNGRELPQKNIIIGIENKNIISIHKAIKTDRVNEKVELIDARDYTVLPGLIDTHVHIMMDPDYDIYSWFKFLEEKEEIVLLKAASNLSKALRSGITTIRDCGSYGNMGFILREALERNIFKGPRLLTCGNVITLSDGHGHYIGKYADDILEIKKAIRSLNKLNVDFIKFMPTGGRLTATSGLRRIQYNLDEIKVLVDEAHQRRKKVAAHATVTEGIINCVEAGVDTIEHCSWFDSDSGFKFDIEATKKMVDKGIFVGFTLAAFAKHCSDKEEREVQKEMWRKTYQAGVKMIAGTDAGVPMVKFNEMHISIKLLTEWIGLSNLEAITAATADSAKAIGLDDKIGIIEEGKLADIVIIDGNPVDNIETLQKVVMVIKDGEIFYRDKTKI